MSESHGARPPGETTGGSVSELNATSGDIRILMRELGVLANKVDRLIEDRKEDKSDVKSYIEEFKTEFKDFRKDDFKPLRDDVSKLRLKWAWMAGVGAVIGLFSAAVIDILKSHIH